MLVWRPQGDSFVSLALRSYLSFCVAPRSTQMLASIPFRGTQIHARTVHLLTAVVWLYIRSMYRSLFTSAVVVPMAVVTFTGGLAPMSSDLVHALCAGPSAIDCVARAPRPLNAPGNPLRHGPTFFDVSTATTSPSTALLSAYLR